MVGGPAGGDEPLRRAGGMQNRTSRERSPARTSLPRARLSRDARVAQIRTRPLPSPGRRSVFCRGRRRRSHNQRPLLSRGSVWEWRSLLRAADPKKNVWPCLNRLIDVPTVLISVVTNCGQTWGEGNGGAVICLGFGRSPEDGQRQTTCGGRSGQGRPLDSTGYSVRSRVMAIVRALGGRRGTAKHVTPFE
jgi:hypothetical protein